MKFLPPILILLFSILVSELYAQKSSEYSLIDKRALQIPETSTHSSDSIAAFINANFNTDLEKTRAVFIWIVNNIDYDADNMFALNFYETQQQKIDKVLRNRRGICENYAALFKDVCSKSGVKCEVIEGYVKQNGFTDYLPHAWCAAYIDSVWFVFDPTWAAGYISDGRFYRKLNNAYFKMPPRISIKNHMPFDYLWQFLNCPLSCQQFYDGKTEADFSKPFFSYPDSINVYEKLSKIEQFTDQVRRIEQNGIKNSLIFDRLQHLKGEIEGDKQSRVVNLFNSASVDFNEGINAFNTFIDYRNKRFTPLKSDPEIQHMIDTATRQYTLAKQKLSEIKNPDANMGAMILTLNQAIENALDKLREQQEFLTKYFSKGKANRKSMFYTETYIRTR